jgi:HEPN domain-containing protein
VNRAELQQLARDRILDAKALLDAARWSGAYYLAGYAVECGLKACVVVYLQKSDDFPEKKFSEQCWTHNLAQLLDLAGLKPVLAADGVADPELLKRWNVVREWTEASRYERWTKDDAEQLYEAITNKKHGMLPWIKRHW